MADTTSEQAPSVRKKIKWLKKGFLFIVLIIYWIIFNYCDPFGIKEGTEEGSTRVFHALGMPGYGVGNPETHRHVAVVTVNDQTFSDSGSVFASQRWPLSYISQNSILMKILNANPAALFVDVRFIYPKSNQKGDKTLDEAFKPVIDLAREKRIPIVFARGDGGLEEEGKAEEDKKDPSGSEKADRQKKTKEKEDGFRQPDLPGVLKEVQVFSNGDSEEVHYPLLREEKGNPKKFIFLNPALKLYDELCNPQWKTPAGNFAAPKGAIAPLCKGYDIETYKAPLILKWGLVRDPSQRFVSEVGIQQQELDHRLVSSTWSRAAVDFKRGLVAVSDKLAAVIPDADRGVEKRNYYPLTISAQHLFCDTAKDDFCNGTTSYDHARQSECEEAAKKHLPAPGGSSCEDSLYEDPKHPVVNDYLKDRVVFYGTDLRDEHDDEDVTFIGRIPGVVVHAMAFDNLVTYGHLYYHVYNKNILWMPVLKWFNFGVWIMLACYMVFLKKDSAEPGWISRKLHALYFMVCRCLSVGGLSWLNGVKKTFSRYWWGDMLVPGRRYCRPRKSICIFLPLALGLFAGVVGYILKDPVEGAAFLGFIVGGYFLLFFNVEKGYCLNIMLIGMIEGLIFQLNCTSWLRWGNTDWMSLAVLWTSTQRGEFVESMEPVLNKGTDKAKRLLFAVHGEKLLEWSNRGRQIIWKTKGK